MAARTAVFVAVFTARGGFSIFAFSEGGEDVGMRSDVGGIEAMP